jgi:glycosyltransferase involved in cell wall biosynthesis
MAPKTISFALLAFNEEANIERTLRSISWADEIVLVDSGSTDNTIEIAKRCGARVFVEPWKGYGGQMNSAIEKCNSDWTFSLDADEEITPELTAEIQQLLAAPYPRDDPPFRAYWIRRRNFFLGRWIRHGGFYPDPKLRLFVHGAALLALNSEPHATVVFDGPTATLRCDMLHYAYPSLALYIEHMDRYSSASVPLVLRRGKTSRSLPAFLFNVALNPIATFFYNYVVRLGFLDGREGLLYHLYHSVYVSWKYAKAWERSRT